MESLLLAHLLVVSCAAAAGEEAALQRFQTSQIYMGVSFAIVVYAPDAATANHAFQAAYRRIGELEKMMTAYDADSELMRLCRSAPTPGPVPVSPDLCRVLQEAAEWSARTEGAFDVTVGPLTKLWRRSRRRYELPDAASLAEARRSVGYQHMIVNPQQRTVELRRPGMQIDLGGLAPGYAADEALILLRAMGLPRALVNASGDISLSDPPPDQPGWRIGIAPLNPDEPPSQFIRAANLAVATSGDARQFVEIGGKRYSHILDPRTGHGLLGRSSVSVVAPSGMAADALATAVSVLGPEKGLALIEQTPPAAAMIVRAEEDGTVKTYASRRWADYLERR